MAEIFSVSSVGIPQLRFGLPVRVRLGDAVTGPEFGEVDALIKSETGEQ